MKMLRPRWRAVGFILGMLWLTEPRAYAYLDGGSGSSLIQFLLAGSAGVAVAVRLWWSKFTARWKKDKKPKAEP